MLHTAQALVISALSTLGTASDDQGPVCSWSFDGTLEDASGRTRDTLSPREGTPRFVGEAELPGVSGEAVALGVRSEDAQYLVAEVSDDVRLGPDYTIEAWIHPTEISTWNRLVLRWGGAPDHAYHLALHEGRASLYHGPADSGLQAAEGGFVTAGRWCHVVGVARRTGTLTIYLNGAPVGTTAFDGTIRPAGDEGLGIGDSPGIPARGTRFRGYVDEVTLWNRALEESEIAERFARRAETLRELERQARTRELADRRERIARMGGGPLPDVVFAERHPGRDPSQHYYANFGYACTDENEWLHGADGARLCRLDPNTGELTVLLDDPGGGIRDPQVDHDGRRIVFSYREHGTHHYNLYEIDADGTGLRRITSGDWDDVEPCYLPDGGIAFCSSRCKRYVLCWLAPVALMFRCEADGTGMRMLSSGAVTENTPSVLPDGRILYTRWEYVNRDAVSFHHLWTMNPDGTGQRVFFGNQIPGGVFIDAQPVPDTGEVVFIDSGYHGSQEHAGRVMVVSGEGGPNDSARARCISPEGQWGFRDPHPVAPGAFLVAQGNTLLLLDDAGKTMRLYAGSRMVHEPRPLRPRTRERAIPSQMDASAATATLYVADVYEGRNMEGVERGSIEELLVLEDLPKPANYHGGGTTPMAHGGTWTLKRILGTVPVAEDGSALFEVPPLRSLYFALLDGEGRSVKQMRSFVTLQPGEQRGCIGCHESRTQPPPSHLGRRARRPAPSRIEPIPGVPEIIDFPRDVQPVLDRHCVSCHDAEERAGGIVLTGHRGPTYSLAYYNLILHRQITDGAGYGWEGTENVDGRPVGNDAPYAMYSAGSPLMRTIDGSHHDVELTADERTLVRLWIDTAGQYAGTYAAYGTGQLGAWWRNNEPIREMADAWPTTPPARDAVERRCAPCHGEMLPRFVTDQVPVDVFGDLEGWQRPTSRFSRHTVFDLTEPEQSLVLMAPLAREAGGYAEGALPEPAPIVEDRGRPPEEVTHRIVFATTEDADYLAILAHLRAARDRLAEIKRFDMPGFAPRAEYVREMVRYGILPRDLDPTRDPVDVYETDRRYWRSLWHAPDSGR